MAIYHCRFKVHSRKGGARAAQAAAYRSGSVVRGRTTNAVRAAAYRSGAALSDPEGEVHDFTSKKGVVWNTILTPDDAPAWATQRSALWNAVERVEKRKDAQLFREAELSIPRELSPRQRIALVRSFVQDQFVAKGMVADIGIHNPKASDGGDQCHAHVMLALRSITREHGFGPKVRAWNDRALVRDARVAWEAYCNAALEEAGSEARVDHRSLEAQRHDRAPEPHRGRSVHISKPRGGIQAKHAAWAQSHFATRAREAVQAIGRGAAPPLPPLDRLAMGSADERELSFDQQAARARRAVITVQRLGGKRLAQDGVAHALETARRLRGTAPERPVEPAQELWGHER